MLIHRRPARDPTSDLDADIIYIYAYFKAKAKKAALRGNESA